MKTNLFKVKKIKKNNITVEEEDLKNPLLLFFRRHGCLISLLLFIIATIVLLIALRLAISGLISSIDPNDKFEEQEPDFNYGDGNVNLTDQENNDKFINKYANAFKKEGIIFIEKVITENGMTIVYYSDHSSKLIRTDGTIYRISAKADGSYGVDEQGTINYIAKRKIVTIKEIKQLDSQTTIIYYSDGSAEITKNGQTILVRNSANIKLQENDYDLFAVNPSMTSYKEKIKQVGNILLTYYTDGTIKVEKDNNIYIVRNPEDINITTNNVTFPNHNEAKVEHTKVLKDGTQITYFTDGSALIETYYKTETMVRKNGHIVLNGDKNFHEIIENDISFKITQITTDKGDTITYYDNGAAVIEYKNGTKVYIEENSNIKFDQNGNIKNITEQPSDAKSTKHLPDGTIITDFKNGKSRVIDTNGQNYIIDTDDLLFDKDGNLIDENLTNTYNPREEDTEPDEDDTPTEPDEEDNGEVNATIDAKEDNYYDFNLINTTKKTVDYKIVIEETQDYSKYDIENLDAKFVRYQLIVEDKYFDGIKLNNNIWQYNNKTNYVLYEGQLSSNTKLNVGLHLYIDYADLSNSEQNKAFIGTVKVYMTQLNQ